MPTNYTTQGFVQLTGVTFTGAEGGAGSTLSWTSVLRSNSDLDIIDQDDDGRLDAGGATPDEFDHTGSAGTEVFTGYTITSGGLEYGVFSNGSGYFVPIPVNGIGQGIIPGSGTTNVFQVETTGAVFLCFGEGTRIATPDGARPVETLSEGDLVLTADGRAVPVLWLGHQTLRAGIAGSWPVRIAAGALGDGLPLRDLVVTSDHGMILDGMVVTAGALVGAKGIDPVPLAEVAGGLTVFHVETEAHEVLLAEGAPTESFVDVAGRRMFDNHAAFVNRHGTERIVPEMALPRVTSSRLLPDALRKRLGFTADPASALRLA